MALSRPHGALSRQRWKWLSLAIPPDLLLAGLGDDTEGPHTIDILSPVLAQHLQDRGFAEMHLHVGAALDFRQWWITAVRAVAQTEFGPQQFRSAGAEMDEGRALAPWLMRAAIVRCLLAAHLSRVRARPGRSLLQFVTDDAINRVTGVLGAGFAALLLQVTAELQAARIYDTEWAATKTLYREISGVKQPWQPRNRFDLDGADPIDVYLTRPRMHQESAEVLFIREALAHLRSAGSNDTLFRQLFWQVIRIRGMFYRHVVIRPMTPGLQWFVRFYGRGRPVSRILTVQAQADSASALCGGERGLKSLELRTSPSASITELLSMLDGVEQTAARWPNLETGIVLHFTKDRGGNAMPGLPIAGGARSFADPSLERGDGSPSGYRYSRFYLEKRNEAMAAAWLVRTLPLSLRTVRGLDVCTDELGVGNWVLAPLVRHVRRASEDGVMAVRQRLSRELPPLRLTIHAGEDFVHLLTGLRNLYEAMEAFEMRQGDRIGHGMALGVDARNWALRAGCVAVSREDRLFDLAWEWAWYGREGNDPGKSRAHQIEYEIRSLSAKIFGRALAPFEAAALAVKLRSEDSLKAVGFPLGPIPPARPQDALLRDYLTDRRVFETGREIIWVDPSTEGEALANLQAGLRRTVASRCLTVEVNPTSNLLIGDLGDLTNHPFWRLRPPAGGVDAPPVSVCIGSDDPVTFNSNLPEEYQWLFDAMQLAGLGEEDARQWLDRTRAAGMESRFTIARNDSGRLPRIPPRESLFSLLNLDPSTAEPL
jgi:hypothetical protein